MRGDVAEHLLEFIKSLEREIEFALRHKLDVAADLMRMTRLELLTQLHGISDEELQAFSDSLSSDKPTRGGSAVSQSSPKR